MQPWLVWFSGLSARLGTKRSKIGFPVGAQAWAGGQVPLWGSAGGNLWMFLYHIDVSLSFLLPSPLSKNK